MTSRWIVVMTMALISGVIASPGHESAFAHEPRPVSALPPEQGVWSPPINGLQARLELVEKPKLFGTRWLVPYLNLRNVSDIGNAMEVLCDDRHLKVELVDRDGKVVRGGSATSRSGPTPDLSLVILPHDSSMRISLECRNWGVPKNAVAMVSTDSGAWVITQQEKGNVYLRLTLSGAPSKSERIQWHGEIRTPLVPVDWE